MKAFIGIVLLLIICSLLLWNIYLVSEHKQELDDCRIEIEKQIARAEELRSTLDELTGFTDTTLSQAIAWIEESRRTHQQMIDNPHFCNEYTGDVEFHQSCVDKYDKVLEVLRYYGSLK